MNSKILQILKREYLVRVKKKSFLIMTILGPILMASVMIVPILLTMYSDDVSKIGIVDESGYFSEETFNDSKGITYKGIHLEIDEAKREIENLGIDYILYIPEPAYVFPSKVYIVSPKGSNLKVEADVKGQINHDLRRLRLQKAGVSEDVIRKMNDGVTVMAQKINVESGETEESNSAINLAVGMILAITIYFFIFMYGSQVMRGVIEEKTNRIVEVIISSVKPFQLMMGKILGIALVGLTQFLLWVLLTFAIVTVFNLGIAGEIGQEQVQEMTQMGQVVAADDITGNVGEGSQMLSMMRVIYGMNFPKILGMFLFYFLFGYLLYAALFAAIGAAVDNETDTQQFMLPLTIPLVVSIIVAQFIASSPDGPISFWFSQIPLTSPVSMMVRAPHEIPILQLISSMVLLILTFIGTTWLAGRIYRVGILMYGKKPSYKELFKWIRFKG
jgi:ABC-2 type transport system permease protein